MFEPTELQNRIATLFLKELNLDVPSVDIDLFETGSLDSLAFVNLLVHLEQEFRLSISLDELELDNFRSIEKIAEFVAGRNGKETLKATKPS